MACKLHLKVFKKKGRAKLTVKSCFILPAGSQYRFMCRVCVCVCVCARVRARTCAHALWSVSSGRVCVCVYCGL